MLKRILWISGGAVGVIILLMAIIWRQVTYVPTGYAQSSPSSASTSTSASPTTPSPINPTQARKEKKRIWLKVSNTLGRYEGLRGQVKLNLNEINTLISSQLVEKAERNQKPQIVLNTNTNIKDDKLVVGTIINVQEMTKELGDGERAKFAQALSKLPLVDKSSIYIEVEGKPIVRNNQIGLEDGARFKVGNISMNISQLAQYTGISEAFLKDKITKQRTIVPMVVENLTMVGDGMIVSGSGTAW